MTNVEEISALRERVEVSAIERFLAEEVVRLQDENRKLRRDNGRLERTVRVLSATLAMGRPEAADLVDPLVDERGRF